MKATRQKPRRKVTFRTAEFDAMRAYAWAAFWDAAIAKARASRASGKTAAKAS